MSGEYEIEEDEPVGKTIQFFKEPIKQVEKCPVDEAYLSSYEEMKADERVIKSNLEIMNESIKAARMGTEKTLTLGKMVAKFTDVAAGTTVDYKAMIEDLIGKVDKETLAKYTKPKAAQVRVEVFRLS